MFRGRLFIVRVNISSPFPGNHTEHHRKRNKDPERNPAKKPHSSIFAQRGKNEILSNLYFIHFQISSFPKYISFAIGISNSFYNVPFLSFILDYDQGRLHSKTATGVKRQQNRENNSKTKKNAQFREGKRGQCPRCPSPAPGERRPRLWLIYSLRGQLKS